MQLGLFLLKASSVFVYVKWHSNKNNEAHFLNGVRPNAARRLSFHAYDDPSNVQERATPERQWQPPYLTPHMVYSRVGFLLRNLEGEVDYDAESSSDEDEEYEHKDDPILIWIELYSDKTI